MDKKAFLDKIKLMNIKMNDEFWLSFSELVRNEVIPYQYEALNDNIIDAPKSRCLENFHKALKVKKLRKQNIKTPVYPVDKMEFTEKNSDRNSFLGWCFQDSDAYKWIEAASYSLINRYDKELEEKVIDTARLICSVQLENGYLDTLYIINNQSRIFENLKDMHELYCFGHLTEAAIACREATGNSELFDAAVKFADLICDTFGNNKTEGYPGHELAEYALVKLYCETQNNKYLKTAEFFIYSRGKKPYYFDLERNIKRNAAEIDYFYNQAHIEPIKQSEAVGHAVRGVYLYTGMAALAKQNGDEKLYSACKRLWNDIVKRKLYITGGIGSTADGEAFTFAYDLPNDSAYCETCASIGLIFFARAMTEISPRSEYADVIERALYNTVLASVSKDGKSFFYTNPLEVFPEENKYKNRHIKLQRQKWFGCACCPPNFARLISSLGEYCFGENDENLFIHLYCAAEINSDKAFVKIISKYNENGSVKLEIKRKKDFTLSLRIPEWCNGAFDISVPYVLKNGYAYIEIHHDTVIEVKFKIQPIYIRSSNMIKMNTGKASVMRGPVVYAVESVDNGKNLKLLYLDTAKPLKYNDDKTITAFGIRKEPDEKLYMPFNEKSRQKSCEIKLIPYYKWCNRGIGEMAVFLNCFSSDRGDKNG